MDLPLASEPGFRVVEKDGIRYYPTTEKSNLGSKVYLCPKCGKVWARYYANNSYGWNSYSHYCPSCPSDVLMVSGAFWFPWEREVPSHFTLELLIREFNVWVSLLENDNGRVY